MASALLASVAQAAWAVPNRSLASYAQLKTQASGIVVGRVVGVEPREDRGADGKALVRVEYRLLVASAERGPAEPGGVLTLGAWFPADAGGAFSLGCGPAMSGAENLPGVGETVRVFYSASDGKVWDNGFWPPEPPAHDYDTRPTDRMAEVERGELIRRTHPLGLRIDLRNWYWWALLAAPILPVLVAADYRRVRRAAFSRPSPRSS